MKIVHINTYDWGGAANSCIRLHKGLSNIGVDSNIFLLYKTRKNIEKSFAFILPEIPSTRAGKVLRNLEIFLGKLNKISYLINRPQIFDIFTFPDSPYRITGHSLYKNADIINLHWTTRFLDYSSFFEENNKTIIWTLHDMYPFTGGCHYSGDCNGFQYDCKNCPQLKGTIRPDYASEMLKVKIKAFEKNKKLNLTIVSPSKWLLEQSRLSRLFRLFPHYHIPYSIEEQIYCMKDKIHSKNLLNIPSEKKMILFVSADISNKRKGYSYLKKALSFLKQKKDDYIICIVGGKKKQRGNIYELGRINSEDLMGTVYSAADVFVIPSLEDNLPNTVLESLMCGTPVVGFPAGGIKDMVIHDVNGRLCEKIDSENLALEIEYVLNNENLFNRDHIAEEALKKYSLNVQGEKYFDLYKSLFHEEGGES